MTMTSQLSLTPRLLAVLAAFATTVGTCGVANATGPLNQVVTYQLSGSAPVADYISYQTDTGQTGQTQQAHVPLPWQTQFNATPWKAFMISDQSPGSITCTNL